MSCGGSVVKPDVGAKVIVAHLWWEWWNNGGEVVSKWWRSGGTIGHHYIDAAY